jgi:peroxiredoxin
MKKILILIAILCSVIVGLIDWRSAAVFAQNQEQAEREARMKAAADALAHPFDDLSGKEAANIKFVTFDGKAMQLSEFKGKPVVLSFFRFKQCPPCIDQLETLSRISARHQKSGLKIIGLIRERGDVKSSPEEIKKALEQFKVSYPVGYATDDIANLYGHVKIVPYNVYITSSGVILSQTAGQSQEAMEQTIQSLLRK